MARTLDPYGLSRVVRPAGVLPQAADVVDPSLPIGPDELLIDVDHLNIDAADVSNGQITAQVGFDEDFREAMEEFGGGGDLLAEVETSAPAEGWGVERFTDGDIEGVTLTQEFSSIEELQTILSTSSIASGESGGWEDLSFTETDDSIRFDASLSAPGLEGTEDLGMEEVGAFLDFDFQIAVTFPGEVIEHNGVLEDQTVVWDLDEESLAGADLFAENLRRYRAGEPLLHEVTPT